MTPLGTRTYKEMLGGQPVATAGEDLVRLRTVGKRVARVANRPDFKWRFNLIKDKKTINMVSAEVERSRSTKESCRPAERSGNGLRHGTRGRPRTARHGAERVTQQLAVFGGLTAVRIRRSEDRDDAGAEERPDRRPGGRSDRQRPVALLPEA